MNYRLIKAKQKRKVNYYIHCIGSGSIWGVNTNYYGKTIPLSGVFTTEHIEPKNAPKWVQKKWNDFNRES